MGVIRTYRAAVASTLAATGVFSDVDVVRGHYTQKDLTRLTMRSPAAAVSIEGARAAQPVGGTPMSTLACAVVVQAMNGRGSNTLDHGAQALDLAETVYRLAAPGFGTVDWGMSGVHMEAPENVSCESLYLPRLDEEGVALWLVAWYQNVNLVDTASLNLDDFVSFNARYLQPGDIYDSAEDLIEDLHV